MKNIFLFLCLACAAFLSAAQGPKAPDLGRIADQKEKIRALLDYCDSLKAGGFGSAANILSRNKALLETSRQGLTLVSAGDPLDSARFLSFAAYAYGHRMDLQTDSIQYYYEQSLDLATRAHSTSLIANACGSLMHIAFEMRGSGKLEGYRKQLQSILDTTTDNIVLRDGYSVLGSYFQHKAYYSTAQDYYLKSITIRRRQLDTLHDPKSRLDFANQSYLLAQLYMNTGLTEKALATLYDGNRFKGLTGLVDARFVASFIDAFCKLDRIDSALYYLHNSVDTLEIRLKGRPTIPAEVVMPNLSVASYYMAKAQWDKALPLLDKADSLTRGKDETFLTYEIQRRQGKYFVGTGHPAKAIPLLALALPTASLLSRENYTDILKDIALARKNMGDAAGALQYYQQYVASLDSLTNEKISRTFADQETRYETGIKEERIVLLDKDNRLQALSLQNASRTRGLLVLGLVALGIFALLLFFFYRNKERLNKQLGIANTQLAIANDTKTKLFGIISHDLRSPISRIVQLLQIQRENPDMLDDEARRRNEERIRTASGHLLGTMEDLLLWSKSQMLQFTPRSFPVAVATLVSKEVDLQQEYIVGKQLTIRQDIDGSLSFTTDENFLAVIVRNLLQNALKYSDSNSTITITASAPSSTASRSTTAASSSTRFPASPASASVSTRTAAPFSTRIAASSAADKGTRVSGASIMITNPSATADAAALNARLLDSTVRSQDSGLGLQIANSLAASIGARISFFRQQHTLTALLELSVDFQ